MSSRRRLAVVGASVRAAAQSAVRAGFGVVGADLFADADLDGVCPVAKVDDYPDGFADWLAAQDVDAWVYTGALENYPELVDRLATIAPLWGVSGAALRYCRDPLALQAACREADIAFPETLPPGETPASPEAWLAKTYGHSNGAGVSLWGEHQDASAYAQRRLAGESLAVIYAVGERQPVLLGMTKQLVDADWVYRGSIGPVQPNEPQAEQLAVIGALLHGPLGLRGVVGVDLINDEGVLHPVEINPRYTASVEVLERAAGRSALACLADEVTESWSFGAMIHGKRIVYAEEPLTITAELEAWMAAEQAADRLADRPRLGELIPAGRPVCTRFVWSADQHQLDALMSNDSLIVTEIGANTTE